MQVSRDAGKGDRDHRAVYGIHQKTEADADENEITVHFEKSKSKMMQEVYKIAARGVNTERTLTLRGPIPANHDSCGDVLRLEKRVHEKNALVKASLTFSVILAVSPYILAFRR